MMKKSRNNRRQQKRLKVARGVRVPVQMFPVMPFIGEAVEATLINISEGGMALMTEGWEPKGALKKNKEIRVHFHLPGHPLQECRALITHKFSTKDGNTVIGIKFKKITAALHKEIRKMATDNQLCDERIQQEKPWCDISCAFHNLCRKPIRVVGHPDAPGRMEIALQSLDRVA